jgi:hypothetical protein
MNAESETKVAKKLKQWNSTLREETDALHVMAFNSIREIGLADQSLPCG